MFPCEASIDLSLINLPLYLAVYKAEYNIEIYLPISSITMIPFYLLLGVSKFHFLSTFLPHRLRMKNYKLEFDFRKYTIPSLMRKYRTGSINDLNDNLGYNFQKDKNRNMTLNICYTRVWSVCVKLYSTGEECVCGVWRVRVQYNI